MRGPEITEFVHSFYTKAYKHSLISELGSCDDWTWIACRVNLFHGNFHTRAGRYCIATFADFGLISTTDTKTGMGRVMELDLKKAVDVHDQRCSRACSWVKFGCSVVFRGFLWNAVFVFRHRKNRTWSNNKTAIQRRLRYRCIILKRMPRFCVHMIPCILKYSKGGHKWLRQFDRSELTTYENKTMPPGSEAFANAFQLTEVLFGSNILEFYCTCSLPHFNNLLTLLRRCIWSLPFIFKWTNHPPANQADLFSLCLQTKVVPSHNATNFWERYHRFVKTQRQVDSKAQFVHFDHQLRLALESGRSLPFEGPCTSVLLVSILIGWSNR